MADSVVLHGVSEDLLRVAIAAHLARYKGLSRAHTCSDLQVFLRRCTDHELDPLTVRRADVELFVRWLEEVRRFKPSTMSRRLSVVTCFYRTCVIDAVLDASPAAYVRRPPVSTESPTLGLSHLQFEAMIVAARTSTSLFDFALVALLGLLGLRVFEACNSTIDELLRRDVLDLLDALRIDRCVLIGHSMGATTAGLVTAAAPNRVMALILEDAVPPRLGSLERPPLPRPDEELPFDWPLVNALRAQLTNPDPAWWQDAQRIAVPTLVIAGGPPSHIPQADLHELAARLVDGRLVEIPVGHMVHVQAPGEFVAAIRTFLIDL